MIFLCLRNASAIWYAVSSLPLPFSAFMLQSMKRQFDWMYPSSETILSILGEKGCGPEPLFFTKINPVSSHLPVQRFAAHSLVKSNGMFFNLASAWRDFRRYVHG